MERRSSVTTMGLKMQVGALCRLFFVFALALIHEQCVAQAEAEWTVMVFMNAKNDLEPDALANFREIASIGGTSKVNIVVELGRPTANIVAEYGPWSGVLRFKVEKGMTPIPDHAVADLRANPQLSDLGSSVALDDFIMWSAAKFPAKKYMLVIWNHGQGWRLQMAPTQLNQQSASTPHALDQRSLPYVGGFKAVSFDGVTGHFLYNSDIQQALNHFKQINRKSVDVLGFDACLMGMLETAYAFKTTTLFMVASEELEAPAGWDYVPIVQIITQKPTIAPLDLSKAIVDSYSTRYGKFHYATLSVFDSEQVGSLAGAVSKLADLFIAKLPQERRNIEAVRSGLVSYGSNRDIHTSVDLATFVSAYEKKTNDAEIKDAAKNVQDAISKLVKANYASDVSANEMGSKGIAIYFPATNSDFQSDPYHDGYLKGNSDHAVQFVKDERWSDFISSFLH
jgi:hypothetical protein